MSVHSARNVSGFGNHLRWDPIRAEAQLESLFQWADQELPAGGSARLCEDPVHGPALDTALAELDEAFLVEDPVALGRAFSEFGTVIHRAAEDYRAGAGGPQ